MGYLIVKNLKLDKKNNRISGDVADSNVTDYNDNYMYYPTEDIYSSLKTWEEKYARLVYSVITGGIHIYGSHKLRKIELGTNIKELENYMEEARELGYVGVYNKHKDLIESIFKEKREYIIKFTEDKGYLRKIDTRNYYLTLIPENAKKYTKGEIGKISGIGKHEIVKYDEEVYKYKENNYKIYIEAILNSEGDIKKEDLINFCKEYEGESDLRGKFTSYVTLKEKYPNSKLIDEIVRLGIIIDYKDKVLWYETRLNLSKDKEFSKDNKPIVISKEETNEYEQEKAYLNIIRQKYPFDYDEVKQYDMLDEAFKQKYISQEIYKDFYEEQYEEEYEIVGT